MSVSVPQGVIADIYNRLQALESQVGQASTGNEALQATYLTVGPSGVVGPSWLAGLQGLDPADLSTAQGLLDLVTPDSGLGSVHLNITGGLSSVSWPGGYRSNGTTITGAHYTTWCIAVASSTDGGTVNSFWWECDWAGGNPGTFTVYAGSDGSVGAGNTANFYWISLGW